VANNKNPNQKSLRWFWSLTVNGRWRGRIGYPGRGQGPVSKELDAWAKAGLL